MAGLCDAWHWSEDDRLLHALPLHHIHGIVNALLCPHAAGAAVEFLPKFSPTAVWECLQVRVMRNDLYIIYAPWLVFPETRRSRPPAIFKTVANRIRKVSQIQTILVLGQREEQAINVFMGVPTMYSHLLSVHENMEPAQQSAAQRAASRLRLTVSGSAACPIPIMRRWEQLSGGLSRFVPCRPRSYYCTDGKLYETSIFDFLRTPSICNRDKMCN